jgi:hypothetical protein
MLNSGQMYVGVDDLLELLQSVALDMRCSPNIRSSALKLVKHQTNRNQGSDAG